MYVKLNETGRSMIEMLGVLAVMGVLSVGGIFGYTVAMSRHKANEIMQIVSVGTQEIQLGKKPEFWNFTGATFGTTGTYKGVPAFVTVDVEDKSVCQILKQQASGLYIVEGDCE
jgi:hypothetical protein